MYNISFGDTKESRFLCCLLCKWPSVIFTEFTTPNPLYWNKIEKRQQDLQKILVVIFIWKALN